MSEIDVAEAELIQKYASLKKVLNDAYDQASRGKGNERHAGGLPFDEQPIFKVAILTGADFLSGQAIKKITEAPTLLSLKGKEAAYNEILGAINYLAALAIFYKKDLQKK